MASALQNRRVKGNLRSLRPLPTDVDFSSNDYLGLARDPNQMLVVDLFVRQLAQRHDLPLGATGSRLISGDFGYTHELENEVAEIHGAKAALLFNSGYDANLSVISCLACDVIIYDELIHNSLHMGIRLWLSARKNRRALPFRHNDLNHLRTILGELGNECATVLMESVYSMDGDEGPIHGALDLASEFGAKVVCDEAHGLGVLSATGALSDCTHPALGFCVYTYGKAAGAHGAMVCCPSTMARDYLINYAYPFIYSTALPPHSLAVIRAAYQTLTSVRGSKLRTTLNTLIVEFKDFMRPVLQKYKDVYLLPSETPIQALIVPGNVLCSKLCDLIYAKSKIRLFPIRAPTVSLERVRIVLHANNTFEEVRRLVGLLEESLEELYVVPTVAKL